MTAFKVLDGSRLRHEPLGECLKLHKNVLVTFNYFSKITSEIIGMSVVKNKLIKDIGR